MVEIDRITELSVYKLGFRQTSRCFHCPRYPGRGAVVLVEVPIGHQILVRRNLRACVGDGTLFLGNAT